ncbi:MAG: hypothetical protein ACXVLQ_08855, partial [Bacteriovorax sp.]
MKSLLIALSCLIMGSAVAGPSVSGGVIYREDFEKCANKKEKVDLSITAIMAPHRFTGLLSEGKNQGTLLDCSLGNNNRSAITGEENVWTC